SAQCIVYAGQTAQYTAVDSIDPPHYGGNRLAIYMNENRFQNQRAWNQTLLHGCFLDTGTVGEGVDWSSLTHALGHCDWHYHTGPGQVAQRIADAEVVVTNKVVLDAATIATADKLKLICIAATGTNNVDLDAAAEHGIPVVNVRGY